MWSCVGGTPRHPLHTMRYSILGFAIAPLAFLSFGGLGAKAHQAVSYSESITCAAIGNDRMMRAALGCPVMDLPSPPSD